MASQTFPGASVPWGYAYPSYPGSTPTFSTGLTIDATGEKAAFVGRVFFKERTGTKDITKVGIRFGAVTKAGGSGLTISLQDVNAAAGPPMQPDETQDQTVAVANGDAAFATDTWLQSGALSANRTVAYGALLAVVIEFDGSGRQGADSVVISGLAAAVSGPLHQAMSVLKTASWAPVAVVPNVILEFSDGTFGTLSGAFPLSAMTSIAFHSGSAADEVALEMTFPGPVKIDGAGGIWLTGGVAADMDVVVYDGTTAMTDGTVAALAEHSIASSNVRPGVVIFPGMLSFTANTTYRLALKPSAATAVTLYYFDVAAAGHFQAHIGGAAWAYTSRVDAGAWAAATATRRPFLWPYVCAFDDAVGGGGGGILLPNKRGGRQ